MIVITMTIPLEPVVKKRPRLGRFGAYTPAKTKNFEAACAMLVRAQIGHLKPITGPVKITARFVFAPPKRPKRSYPCRGDTSNFLKALEDALNGVLWIDDVQVVRSDACKEYDTSGGKSRIELTVEEVMV